MAAAFVRSDNAVHIIGGSPVSGNPAVLHVVWWNGAGVPAANGGFRVIAACEILADAQAVAALHTT